VEGQPSGATGRARHRAGRDVRAPPFLRRTVIATLLSNGVLIAYWGVTSWLPAFLATPSP
jgi:hypothetical protein